MTVTVMDDRIRVSDADRDRVAARLREHYAAGRLSFEEMEERVSAALSAKTAGDLRRVLADLPEPAPVLHRAWDQAPGWPGGPAGPGGRAGPSWHAALPARPAAAAARTGRTGHRGGAAGRRLGVLRPRQPGHAAVPDGLPHRDLHGAADPPPGPPRPAVGLWLPVVPVSVATVRLTGREHRDRLSLASADPPAATLRAAARPRSRP